jgi:hypothetical protein
MMIARVRQAHNALQCFFASVILESEDPSLARCLPKERVESRAELANR